MKRLMTVFAVLLVLTSALAACGASKAPEGMVALEGSDPTYDIYIPETWTASLGGGAVSAYAPDMSNISVQTVTITKGGEGARLYADINDFWENGYKVSLSYNFTDITYSETSEDKLGGETAVKAGYTVKVFDVSAKAVKSYSIMQLIAEHGKNVYIFTYTAETGNYEKHADEVKSVVSNFSFK